MANTSSWRLRIHRLFFSSRWIGASSRSHRYTIPRFVEGAGIAEVGVGVVRGGGRERHTRGNLPGGVGCGRAGAAAGERIIERSLNSVLIERSFSKGRAPAAAPLVAGPPESGTMGRRRTRRSAPEGASPCTTWSFGTAPSSTAPERRPSPATWPSTAGASPRSAPSNGAGTRELDADGAVVAPGWVDIHTHYDGQVSWDPVVAPSSHHGVTTVVMGNCGVGFAPVRPDGHGFLIELMEGVEDIPGTALHEGIDWRWESFGEYLDALARNRPDHRHRRSGASRRGPRLRHGRAGPRGARCRRDRRDRRRRRRRHPPGRGRLLHVAHHPPPVAPRPRPRHHGRSRRADRHRRGHGRGRPRHLPVRLRPPGRRRRPGLDDRDRRTNRCADHLFAGPDAVRSDRLPRRARRGGRPGGERPAHHAPGPGPADRHALRAPELVPSRSWPIRRTDRCGTSRSATRRAALRDPELRARLVAEAPRTRDRSAAYLATAWHQMYRLGDPPDYEPPAGASAQAVADREGRSPQEVVLDWLRRGRGPCLPVLAAGQLRRPRPRGHPSHARAPGRRGRPGRRRRPLLAHLRRQLPHLPAHPLGTRSRPGAAPPAGGGGATPDQRHRRHLRLRRPRPAPTGERWPTST